MLENEIIPLYFAKNSKGYSPEWIQYIKRSIGHIAPHFTMKRMIDDYIARFYDPEDKRFRALAADNYALAREIVAWKEKVAAAWDGIKVISVTEDSIAANGSTGDKYDVTITLDTNGLAHDLGVELVCYRVEDGVEHLYGKFPFSVEKEEGNIVTYHIHDKLVDAGVFRYGYRVYPINPNLPHRQDFAYTRWI